MSEPQPVREWYEVRWTTPTGQTRHKTFEGYRAYMLALRYASRASKQDARIVRCTEQVIVWWGESAKNLDSLPAFRGTRV